MNDEQVVAQSHLYNPVPRPCRPLLAPARAAGGGERRVAYGRRSRRNGTVARRFRGGTGSHSIAERG